MVGRATTTLKLKRLVGITRVAKLSSAKHLAKPGFVSEHELGGDDTGLDLQVFGRNAPENEPS